tara:strand:+ start:64 stop:729 length:666 start_codon:yes stop_codon:yes gene_type:complete
MKVAKAGVTKQERERRAKLFEQGIKFCYKCKEEKTLDCFSKRSASKDGYAPWCRECKRKYDLETKDRKNEMDRRWYQKNKARKREQQSRWVERRGRARRKERYHTDPCYKLRSLTSGMVWKRLKSGKGGESILPYVDWNSYEELKEHLESQFEDWMTWENHGMLHPTEKRWHIDHIKPQSVLLEGVTSMDDPKFRECWSLENLRPLEARENIIKGSKLLDE